MKWPFGKREEPDEPRDERFVELPEQVEGQDFHEMHVMLSGHRFKGCTFRYSILGFSGVGDLTIDDCDVQRCSFMFTGAAANTMQFLAELYQADPAVVEKCFDAIRENDLQGIDL